MAYSRVSQTKVIKVPIQEHYRWLEGLLTGNNKRQAFVCVSRLCVALSERMRGDEAGCQQTVKLPSVQSPAADCAIYMYFAFTPPFFPHTE